jgi:hypothetical protein
VIKERLLYNPRKIETYFVTIIFAAKETYVSNHNSVAN